MAAARDDHYLGIMPTDPYVTRHNEIRAHQRVEYNRAHDIPNAPQPTTPRPRGDLDAQMRLIDAEAWASAIRTARAGGDGWDLSGPRSS